MIWRVSRVEGRVFLSSRFLALLVLAASGFLLAIAESPHGCGPRKTKDASHPEALSGPPAVRLPVVAGEFYPAEGRVLEVAIRKMLAAASLPKGPAGTLFGVVSPHAGYEYSGPVAAHSYLRLQSEKVDRIVIVAPSHYAAFDGFAVPLEGAFRTPLGDVTLDREAIAWLRARSPHFAVVPEAWTREHSLEVQLPWLRVVQPSARVVPIVMGQQQMPICEALAGHLQALARTLPGRTVFVASSDLSHYHPYQEAVSIDAGLAGAVEALDPALLHQGDREGRWEACGLGPITTVLLTCRGLGATRALRLAMANSGDASGERSRVVGYGAWAFEAGPPGATRARADSALLSEHELDVLWKLATRSAVAAVMRSKPPALPADEPALGRLGAAFVTLMEKGALRGCIGTVEPRMSLGETVREMAGEAALRDPRFAPVTAAELPDLEFEISVLSPMVPVKDAAEIQVGRHGLRVTRGGYSGILLPQVPIDLGWDRNTFLAEVCRKAGLPPDAWKQGSELLRFEAQVYPDKKRRVAR
ncbi:MAG: AmmeMemoRadiSam system protein B [Candidatus Wallbacteria bacterium]|nr:AmmeMemoRadiSam system protein B [Candidatus Wallbacteria bacterium]